MEEKRPLEESHKWQREKGKEGAMERDREREKENEREEGLCM